MDTYPPYGDLTPERLAMIKPYLAGRNVFDLGCGVTAPHAPLLHPLCKHLTCVDPKGQHAHRHTPPSVPSGVKRMFQYFDTMRSLCEDSVAFLSWPNASGTRGLSMLVGQCETIIFLGRSDGVTLCGDRNLWRLFMQKEVVFAHKGARDHLVVYQGARTEPYALETEAYAVGGLCADPGVYARDPVLRYYCQNTGRSRNPPRT